MSRIAIHGRFRSIAVSLFFTAASVVAIGFYASGESDPALTLVNAIDQNIKGLAQSKSVTVSRDGKLVFVANESDQAMLVLERNGVTGWLKLDSVLQGHWAKRQFANARVFDQLVVAEGVSVSPDDRHVYVPGRVALFVFAREAKRGLSLVQVVQDRVGIDDSTGIRSTIFSPDGRYVYAVGAAEDTLIVFRRNPDDGRLSLVQVLQDTSPYRKTRAIPNVDKADGLSSPLEICLSADGKNLYAVSYRDNSLAAFQRSAQTGKLSFAEMHQNLSDPLNDNQLQFPTSVAISPDGRNVYTTSLFKGTLAIFKRDATTGKLVFQQALRDDKQGIDGLAGPQFVVVHPSGKSVYVAGSKDNAIAVFDRDRSGGLTFKAAVKDGIDGVKGLKDVHRLTISPDGRHLFATCRGNSRSVAHGLAVFSIAENVVKQEGSGGSNGEAASTNSPPLTTPGPGVSKREIPKTAETRTRVQTKDGCIEFIESHKEFVSKTVNRFGRNAIAVSGDGQHVYALRDRESALVAYKRDSTSGRLTYLQSFTRNVGRKTTGAESVKALHRPCRLAISRDDRNIYVINNLDTPVVVFARDPKTGRLTLTQTIQDNVRALMTPTDIVLSSDGKHAYVIGQTEFCIVVFRRNPDNGQLTLLEIIQDEHAGKPIPGFPIIIKRLDGARSVPGVKFLERLALSNDGRWLYATSFKDHAVSLLARNPETGKLSFVEATEDKYDRKGLMCASAVALSTDQRYLYVGKSNATRTLAIFRRNAQDGKMKFVEVIREADGLSKTRAICLSPDGKRIYVAGSGDHAITVFESDPQTGKAKPVDLMKDGERGGASLRFVSSLAMSRDGKHLYAAAKNATVSVFSVGSRRSSGEK